MDRYYEGELYRAEITGAVSAKEASVSTAQDTGRAHALMADDTKVEIR